MVRARLQSWFILEAGDRPLTSGGFQLLWGIYLAGLAYALMKAADTRAGGVGGVSFLLLLGVLIVGFLYAYGHAYTLKVRDSWLIQVTAVILSGIVFAELIWLGLKSPLAFGFQEEGPVRPIRRGTLFYAFAAIIVYFRLQRRVSPKCESAGDVSNDLHKIHFDNSWRIFQMTASIAAIVVIGVVFTLGTVLIERQDVILQPLAFFVGGLLWGFFPMAIQLLVEMVFLERDYENNRVEEQ